MRNIFSTKVFLVISFILISSISQSCTWRKCQATGIILSNYRNTQSNSTNNVEEPDIVIARLLDKNFIEIVSSKIDFKDNNNEQIKAKEISKNIVVNQIANTETISIYYRYSRAIEPKLAMHIVNTIMDTYFTEFPSSPKILPKPIEQMSKEEYFRYQMLPKRLEIIKYASSSCSTLLNQK